MTIIIELLFFIVADENNYAPAMPVIGYDTHMSLTKISRSRQINSWNTHSKNCKDCKDAANTFRTIISLFLVLGLVKLYDLIQTGINISNNLELGILILLLIALFILSYRKQSKYVTKRVKFFSKDSN